MAKKNAHNLDAYQFVVRPLAEEDGGGFLVEYPDVPRCIADGDTPGEAVANGRVALRACLETLEELNLPVPKPGAGASGQWRQRIPKSLHARLIERAAREGVSLNMLVTTMIAEGLGGRDRAA